MADEPSKVVLVTGAASGIGRHLVGRFAKAGHRALAADVDEPGLARARDEDGWTALRVLTHTLDVRSVDAWEDVLDALERAFGPLDVLLHAAGVIRPGWVHALDPSDVERTLDVNLKGTILGTRAAARRMVPRGRGHIVNLGSLASLAPVPGLSTYVASKFGVRGFSLAAAAELASHGVAVTVVLPDAVATPMLDLQVPYEEAALTFSGGRALRVEEVGDAVLVALDRRPLEVTLPLSRGLLARLSSVVPEAASVLAPLLRKKGREKQRSMRRDRGR
jgi:NAD(P)-dependent dehydrogenase (short-subunit alcohol dehydrogenase family)